MSYLVNKEIPPSSGQHVNSRQDVCAKNQTQWIKVEEPRKGNESERRLALVYLRRSYESQPIRGVRRQQPHRLTLVDGQRRAQEVTDQVDEALQPLLTGALQQLEG